MKNIGLMVMSCALGLACSAQAAITMYATATPGSGDGSTLSTPKYCANGDFDERIENWIWCVSNGVHPKDGTTALGSDRHLVVKVLPGTYYMDATDELLRIRNIPNVQSVTIEAYDLNTTLPLIKVANNTYLNPFYTDWYMISSEDCPYPIRIKYLDLDCNPANLTSTRNAASVNNYRFKLGGVRLSGYDVLIDTVTVYDPVAWDKTWTTNSPPPSGDPGCEVFPIWAGVVYNNQTNISALVRYSNVIGLSTTNGGYGTGIMMYNPWNNVTLARAEYNSVSGSESLIGYGTGSSYGVEFYGNWAGGIAIGVNVDSGWNSHLYFEANVFGGVRKGFSIGSPHGASGQFSNIYIGSNDVYLHGNLYFDCIYNPGLLAYDESVGVHIRGGGSSITVNGNHFEAYTPFDFNGPSGSARYYPIKVNGAHGESTTYEATYDCEIGLVTHVNASVTHNSNSYYRSGYFTASPNSSVPVP